MTGLTDPQRYRKARTRVLDARDRGELTNGQAVSWLERLPAEPAVKQERPVLALGLRGINAVLGRLVDAVRRDP